MIPPPSSVALWRVVSSGGLVIRVFGQGWTSGLVGKSSICLPLCQRSPTPEDNLLFWIWWLIPEKVGEQKGQGQCDSRSHFSVTSAKDEVVLWWAKKKKKNRRRKYGMYSLYFPPMRILNCELPKSMKRYWPSLLIYWQCPALGLTPSLNT